jgi:hypothetical protein
LTLISRLYFNKFAPRVQHLAMLVIVVALFATVSFFVVFAIVSYILKTVVLLFGVLLESNLSKRSNLEL